QYAAGRGCYATRHFLGVCPRWVVGRLACRLSRTDGAPRSARSTGACHAARDSQRTVDVAHWRSQNDACRFGFRCATESPMVASRRAGSVLSRSMGRGLTTHSLARDVLLLIWTCMSTPTTWTMGRIRGATSTPFSATSRGMRLIVGPKAPILVPKRVDTALSRVRVVSTLRGAS